MVKSGKVVKKPAPAEEDPILKAIKSLGGDKDDLDLINDVSDDENDTLITEENLDSDETKLTKKELSIFLGGLGFNKIVQKLIIEKDEDDDDDGEEEFDQEAEVDAAESAAAKTPAKPKHTKLEPEAQLPSRKTAESNEEEVVPLPKGQTVMSIIATKIKRQAMVIKPGGKWYEKELTGIDMTGIEVIEEKLPVEQITKLRDYAENLMKEDLALYKTYQSSNKNRSNFNWIETVQKSGTLNDRMAAYIVLVQDSPVHNLDTLDVLIKMVNVKNNREGLMAVDTLKDLYIGDLLPENRRLLAFDQHPLQLLERLSGGNRNTFDGLLMLWYFESQLKRCYIEFVMALGRLAKDALEINKNKAIKTMFALLVACPEQEQMLLTHLVNKLGDPNKKLATMGSFLLCRLVESHSNMKGVVAGEVERLLFRTNVESQARYFSVCFLNQILLDAEDQALAAKLVSIYFALFKALTKHNEINTRMMSALLTGVNRAFPYAHLDPSAFAEQINATYKIVQMSTFNVAVQALLFLYHALASRNELTDRFYCSLYRKLLDNELTNSSKQALFLNLLYKSLKKDGNDKRRLAFMKRLFQISFSQSPSMICGSLFLVSEVLRETKKTLPLASSRLVIFDDDGGDDEERLKDEDTDDEAAAMDEDVDEPVTELETANLVSKPKTKTSTWVHRANLNRPGGSRTDYDPLGRNPSFANADMTCAWELPALSRHYHPSVALFARTLNESKPVQYNGDPLQDFTLARFLDRFVYRNPKRPEPASSEGGRQAPLLQHTVLGKRRLYKPRGARALAANSEAFLGQAERSVPVDELFFYKYFGQAQRLRDKGDKTKSDDDDSDASSVNSDDFERLLDEIEPKSKKEENDLDFVSDIRAGRGDKKGKEIDSESDDDDEGDEDDDFEEDDEFGEAFKEFEEDIKLAKQYKESDDEEFDEEATDEEKETTKSKKKGSKRHVDEQESDEDLDFLMSKKPRSSNKDKSFDTRSLFASADEFSHILDENTDAVGDAGGSQAMANRDRSHVKQLAWEQERDRFVRGADWKTKKRQHARKGGRSTKAGGSARKISGTSRSSSRIKKGVGQKTQKKQKK